MAVVTVIIILPLLLLLLFCCTFAEAEKVVGWAKNHYLSSCSSPSTKGERLHIPRERYVIVICALFFLFPYARFHKSHHVVIEIL